MIHDSTTQSAVFETVASKSQLKRQAQALRAFGVQLVGLKEAQLLKLPLDERLYRAIVEARRLSPQAARRQLNYIGKLLRSMEVTALQQAAAPLLGSRCKRMP